MVGNTALIPSVRGYGLRLSLNARAVRRTVAQRTSTPQGIARKAPARCQTVSETAIEEIAPTAAGALSLALLSWEVRNRFNIAIPGPQSPGARPWLVERGFHFSIDAIISLDKTCSNAADTLDP
jgi:hypothetical protein